jgi:hypothetical protein
MRNLPYRWILPTTQLLICAIILWPLRSTLLTKEVPLRFSFDISTVPRNQQSPNDSHFSLPLDLDSPEIERSIRNTNRRLWTPTVINIPAALVVLPFVIHNPAKTEWVPNGMDFKRWRAISWPFIGLIFWWIAGRSVEALFAARRSVIHPAIGWVESGIGVLLLLWGIMLLIAPLCAGDSDSDVPWVAICGAGVMWAALGGAVVIARFAQRKIRLRPRGVQAPEALPS